MKIGPDDIRGVVGIVPTPATSDAANWDCDSSVNFAETEKMVDTVVKAGIDILMTTGTFGECASLTEPEVLDFVSCVSATVKGRVPLFAGLTTLNTRDTIRRGRDLLETGVDGLFLGRPMWLPLDQKAIVKYYSDLADAFGSVPIIAYDNPLAFKGKISSEAYGELAKIKAIVAAKHVGGPALERDAVAVGRSLRLLPLEIDWVDFAQKYPDLGQACWSGNIACSPTPIAQLSRAVLGGDWDLARQLTTKLHEALKPMFGLDMERFMTYSIPLGHARFNSAGLVNVGPCRPPYTEVPSDLLAGANKTGELLAALEHEYGTVQ